MAAAELFALLHKPVTREERVEIARRAVAARRDRRQGEEQLNVQLDTKLNRQERARSEAAREERRRGGDDLPVQLNGKMDRQTLADYEREARQPYQRTRLDIQRALERAGVEFSPDGGVRLASAEADR